MEKHPSTRHRTSYVRAAGIVVLSAIGFVSSNMFKDSAQDLVGGPATTIDATQTIKDLESVVIKVSVACASFMAAAKLLIDGDQID